MLLETLDLRTNDVLIYSQNMFNFNNSFRIIFKNEKNKRPKRISYFDVCSYVKDPSPKNLIVYRLLTNVGSLDAYSTKYGYFIKINGKAELVYFDPIFAIKDLRHLRFDFDPKRFRFKIQQVGLTSLTKKEAEPSFAEVYSFDLRAIEAQNQNDKIFADAIFAFDEGYNDEEMMFPKESDQSDEKKIDSFFRTGKVDQRANTMYGVSPQQIAEDRGTKGQSMNPLNSPDGAKVQDLREEIIGLLKQALGIDPDEKNRDAKSAELGGRQATVSSKEGEEKVRSQKSEVRSQLASLDSISKQLEAVPPEIGEAGASRSGKSEEAGKKEEGSKEGKMEKRNKEEGSTRDEVRRTKMEEKKERQEENVIGHKSMVKENNTEVPDAVNVFDLFKSTSKSNELSDRAKESIVLKFE